MVTVCLIAIAVGSVAFFGSLALRRRREDPEPPSWALNELTPPQGTEECVCGRLVARGSLEHHLVVSIPGDDAALAGGPVTGGSAVVADFCPEHCPGGCNQGCEVRSDA